MFKILNLKINITKTGAKWASLDTDVFPQWCVLLLDWIGNHSRLETTAVNVLSPNEPPRRLAVASNRVPQHHSIRRARNYRPYRADGRFIGRSAASRDRGKCRRITLIAFYYTARSWFTTLSSPVQLCRRATLLTTPNHCAYLDP